MHLLLLLSPLPLPPALALALTLLPPPLEHQQLMPRLQALPPQQQHHQ